MLARSIAIASVLSSFTVTQIRCFSSGPRLPLSSLRNSPRSRPPLLTVSVSSSSSPLEVDGIETSEPSLSRRGILGRFLGLVLIESYSSASPAFAKCTDIETCREEGERKVEADLKLNPIVRLSDGVRYRVLRSPTSPSSDRVKEGSSIDLTYSISTASGQYMYSKGFGYEKVEFGGRQESDLGLDSMRVVLGKHNVPVGIEYALMGMGKGEKRRVELPPGVGFETSNWQPEPTTRRGKTQIEQYKRKLTGFGSQPPFPAETVWDVEVLAVR
ncbi:hypothetical protein ACHAWF_005546 [Thalassiosira exigua]